ncbi:MAG TPA: alkaline phosphatase family protein [Terriglobales bacterium]|nr:alkaline phosphatase family protein [Terriglobales bacterium]
MIRTKWFLVALVICIAAGLLYSQLPARNRYRGDHKLIILGVDGMDPQLLERFMAEGKMPNFARLTRQGSFRWLTTSTPPQSPVAWSNLTTGLDPGGHGIFDFIHRDPATMQPYLSTSRVEPPKHNLTLGSWVVPLGSGTAELLRHGQPFWNILEGHGIPTSIFHMPANFPPSASKARTLAGMGTPDLRGGYGTFSFYTDDPTVQAGEVEGGEIIPVMVQNWRVTANLEGPKNSFRKGWPPALIPFTVSVDPVSPVAKIAIQDREFVLREGEWSDWVQVDFSLIPGLESVSGICRLFLKQVHPRFQLYVSPVNIDPADPALPLSTPASLSRDLWREVGDFYTQGIAEDTKALSDGVLDDGEYLQQAREVAAEQRRIFDAEFPKFHRGVFFFYFSSLDLNGHMMWRLMDSHHPAYDPALAAQYGNALESFYEQIDGVLAKVLPTLDANTTLLVLSDHGFAPFYRSFNLNTWLLENGYLALKPGTDQEQGQYFANVDWSRTRAYGLGLNGLYLNLKGREKDGIVQPGSEANTLLDEISSKLLAVRDPSTGLPAITRMSRTSEAYHGPYTQDAPDIIVGYNRGYRAGWKTILGAFPRQLFEDNTNAWSGDHCMDYTLVPGVLLSNRKIDAQSPALTDIAPTILAEFGIAPAHGMMGHSVFQPPAAPQSQTASLGH